MGWLQYKESKTKRVEAEEVLNKANTESRRAFITLSTNTHLIKSNTEDVLQNARRESNKIVNKSADTLKIAEKNLQNTKYITDKARSDIKGIETSVNNHLFNSNKLIDNTQKEFDSIKSSIQLVKKETLSQLDRLKSRNDLTLLADKAISKGDKSAFEALLKNNSEEDPSTIAEILRVKSFYLVGSRIPDDFKLGENGKELKEDEITTDNLISNLKYSDLWFVRGKIAQILSKRKEKKVVEALLYSIENDNNLDVHKIAIDSFCIITGYKRFDILNTSDLLKWWSGHKDEIEKNLK